MNQIVLSLGTNISTHDTTLKNNLKKAVSLLKKKGKFKLESFSSFYKTSPLEVINQNYFLNQVITGKTALTPQEFLNLIKSIEKKMKSKKLFFKGPRIIDIDIIFFNDEIINEKNLTIPHPAFKKRLFVLDPLLEIEKNFINPTNKIKVKNYLLDGLKKNQKIKKYCLSEEEKIFYNISF